MRTLGDMKPRRKQLGMVDHKRATIFMAPKYDRDIHGGHLAQLGFIGYMHEIFNFCDGQRTVREIHRVLSHELRPIPLDTMCDLVCDLDTLGYVTIEW
jgi:hypothetical protein